MDDEINVASEDAGDLVADIGLNFGFDLIDGRTTEDSTGIAARQRRLLWAEGALQAFNSSGGKTGDLSQIFNVFLGRSEIPTSSSNTSSHVQMGSPVVTSHNQSSSSDTSSLMQTDEDL